LFGRMSKFRYRAREAHLDQVCMQGKYAVGQMDYYPNIKDYNYEKNMVLTNDRLNAKVTGWSGNEFKRGG
jgi:hypothetical protein